MAQSPSISTPDLLTVIGISALAYIAGTGLHEHLGHTTACYLLVSLLVGIVCFLILRYRPPRSSHGFYFVWLLGSIGLMSTTGYLLFSGVSGLGDFGTTHDGLFYQVAPEWLWRLILTLAGLACYFLVVLVSVHAID